MSEEELIFQIQSKNVRAFQYLYDAYASALYGTIQKVINCPFASQDILQNVFIKIWSSSDQYQASKGRLFTWVINITRHQAYDYIRSKQFRQALVTDNDYTECMGEGCTIDKQITRFDIRRLLGYLPSKERAIIELFLSGFTCKEIGQLFGLPEGSVKTKMRTSYKKLRLALLN